MLMKKKEKLIPKKRKTYEEAVNMAQSEITARKAHLVALKILLNYPVTRYVDYSMSHM